TEVGSWSIRIKGGAKTDLLKRLIICLSRGKSSFWLGVRPFCGKAQGHLATDRPPPIDGCDLRHKTRGSYASVRSGTVGMCRKSLRSIATKLNASACSLTLESILSMAWYQRTLELPPFRRGF